MNKKKKVNKRKKDQGNAKYNKEFVGIGIITLGLLSMLSLFSFKMGIIGTMIRRTSFTIMGFGGYLFPIAIIIIGTILIFDKFKLKEKNIILGIISIFISLLIILDKGNNSAVGFIDRINKSIILSQVGKGGGFLGSFFGFFFYNLFGTIGTYLVVFFITIISILIITDIKVEDVINLVKLKLQESKKIEKVTKKPKVKPNNIKTENIKILDYTIVDNKEKLKDAKASTEVKEIDIIESIETEIKLEQSKNPVSTYTTPSLNLLKLPVSKQDPNDKKEVLDKAKIIEETMKNFGIDARIVQINRGPTITCYELQPAPGIKLSKIVSLSDNISLSLASSDIRIEAPIPGKSVVGIEVPNNKKDNVLLKEIILSEEYTTLDSKIPLALGKDVSGKAIVSTIDKMPHLLIAGATGSGKSVCINTIIMSILYKSSPEDVKLLLIDPKVVELNIYNGIPHLLIPVVTDAKKASFALNWAVEEMEKRYKLFAQNNVRDIKSYNSKQEDNKEDKLPMIVIIIDELADLMMVAAQEIEDYICRLAQMARAAGMYLIVATQRPSVDVITGTIKANIPSRISFAVSSQIDSRTILDMGGAEKLLGKGDMLFYPSFYSKPSRLQGAFISDEEVEAVVNSLKSQNITEYDKDIIEVVQSAKKVELDDSDELLPTAITLVVEEGQASISFLQRKLKVGYARAARLVDEMEERGIVGGHEGSKPRKVLVSIEDLESMIDQNTEMSV